MAEKLAIEYVPIGEIVPYEKNPRKNDHAVDVVAKSIKEFGFQQPIVLDKDNVIIAGHTRLRAAQQLGLTEVPIIWASDLTPDQVKSYRLMDNKSAEYARWDWRSLKEEFQDLKDVDFDLDMTGFHPAEIDRILGVDEEEDFGKEPKYEINLGEIWKCGEHRVMCADATDEKALDELIGDWKIKLVITSPPYNMAGEMYEDYKDDMKSQAYIKLNIDAVNNIKRHLKGYIFWNLNYNKNSRWEYIEIFHQMVNKVGLKFMENIIWDKGHGLPISSNQMLTRPYEQILVVGDEETIQNEMSHTFVGANVDKIWINKKGQRALTNYWRITTEGTQTKEIRAAFPIALPLKAIRLFTEEIEVVYDPFAGTGSTLIAAEKSNRLCFLTELSPKHCSHAIERWEKFTGKTARKL